MGLKDLYKIIILGEVSDSSVCVEACDTHGDRALRTHATMLTAVPALLSFMPGSAPFRTTTQTPSTNTIMMAKKVAVGVVGTGLVGSELLQQIEATRPLLEKQGLEITIASISKTKPDADGERKPWMLCDDEDGCTLEGVEDAMGDPDAGEAGDFNKMADFLKTVTPHAIIVDATASEAVSDYYPAWLAKGVNVVTPNKKAGSGDLVRWRECLAAMEKTGAQWGDETTVGAGLPILNTLRTDLIATGDSVKTIEGVFSGTLSYLFNTWVVPRRIASPLIPSYPIPSASHPISSHPYSIASQPSIPIALPPSPALPTPS